ncbi:hypothetical protein [uncultured Nonlabens sp.]|uniref:hypothetical protein n=1 Tax=uncultured Nonlabens sp. TaxID=859306 RepID=UPI002602EDA2|nr:hypothetical protein [uncultured Nonlabens sp.]
MRKPKSNLEKGLNYISKLSSSKKEKLMATLKKVKEVQSSDLTTKQKAKEIKRIMWSDQSTSNKLFIGAFLGAITGLFIFGTGGIGIAALGTGVGVWGWLATAAGGSFIASLIQNYENKEKNDK